ncbi:MAG: HAMP domain-containing sensor histidine kinase, partial [Phormidesmis sp.]
GLDSTILILKHRLKADERRPAIEVVEHYEKMPLVLCFPGQLNQVFMNLLANAIDALEESSQGKSFSDLQAASSRITISTGMSSDEQMAVIKIHDNGVGMTEATRQKVFENLFTTKAVGKGTGLGLTIVHQIIVEKHGGTIVVNSEPGQGTEFVVQIPLEIA